jgi:hypothetical protein
MNTIRLTRYTAKPMLQGQQHVWPIKIVAEGLNGAPSAVFVYARAKDGDKQGDVFQCMVSVPQLEEISTVGPVVIDTTTQTPFYRTNIAQFVTRSPEEADEVWNSLLEDAQNLALNLDAVADLESMVVVEVNADGVETV